MKNIFSLVSLLLGIVVSAQTTNLSTSENYIYTKNCLNEDCSKKTEAVQYSDGLGRLKQTISIKSSPTGKDMAVPVEYDPFGRQVKSYLPIPQSGTQNGAIYSNPKSNASQTYGSDLYFYSESVMENSPAAKLLSVTKPGTDYHGHSINYGYEMNTATEVKKYTVTSTSWVNSATDNAITLSGNYSAGQLVKTSVTDEDGHTTTEFKNGKGQTILVRKENTETYYVYNKYGQLAYVIPPLAVSQALTTTLLNDLCYQYRYDSKGRQVEKKLPGKGWEYIVYDKQDRVLMTQDANMGASKQWLFTKYDKFGRAVYTGIFTSPYNYGSEGRQAEQNNANSAATAQNESRSASGFDATGVTAYYTNTVYPTAFTKILSVHYFDTYPAESPERPSQIFSNSTIGDNMGAAVNTKNLPTASYVKNIEDDNWTKSYIWYDNKARPIGTHSINYLGGFTKTESSLDFAGVVLQTRITHARLSSDTPKTITQAFEYDAQNRLKKQWHQVDGNAQELLSENTYNELSQLTNKKVGNNLQTVDYTYNIRGSVTKVNDPASLGTDLFAYSLSYFDPSNNSTGKYSGNVSEVSWKSAMDNVLKKYSYQYDNLNRLTKGIYAEPNASVPGNNFYNESAAYDIAGNITSLQRNTKSFSGTAELIDNLTYTYTGNKLLSVNDGSGNYAGYPDTSGTAISYDANGNMKDHMDKGILQIDYNILDLPDLVKFDKTYVPRFTGMELDYNVKTKYLYRADGVKLRKIYTYGTGKTNLEASTITDYLDGFQYEENYTGSLSNPVLKFVPTSEGYYDFEKNKYIYTYTDHLGNVRLSYSRNTTSGGAEVLEENSYYPFGLRHDTNILSVNNSSYKYQYNGKELQTETGWNDYEARMYMSDIARWGVIDPLSETSRRFSPYNYAYDNPISFVDPDGRKAMAVDEGWSWNVPVSSGWFNERRNFGHFEEFIKLTSSNERERGSAGSTATDPTPKKSIWKSIGNFFRNLFGRKKSSNKIAVGIPEGSFDTGTRLFGLIRNANVNANGESPLEQYRGWRDDPFYHAGESWLDKFARNVNSSHMEILRDEGSGGSLMWGGYGRMSNVASVAEVVIEETATEGSFYSIAFETKLSGDLYPGGTYYSHFKAANTALESGMAPEVMSELGITVPKSSTGSILGKSPTNWVWHHGTEPGVIQLVPKTQHTVGSSYWGTMHPVGKGGMSLWNK